MASGDLWLLLLGPAALFAVGTCGTLISGNDASRLNRFAIAAAALTLALAFATALRVAYAGTLHTATAGAGGIGFSLYLDDISAAMFCLVSFVGLVVINYSRNYMDGDPRRRAFTRFLCLTLTAILLVIISGNMLQFALAWIATSIALHRLLIFYPERPAAIMAARKKFIASRVSEACLIASAVLLYRQFGSLDYATLFAAADALRAAGSVPHAVHYAALLLVLSALVTSAQFPLHGWLIEVMETPTPVSALLHAGIINAGGFLVLRLSHVVSLSLPSLDVLAMIGAATALFGSVVMLTQTSIKVSLAYSTIAQMGFMMLECGLGAFAAALLHIVAHSVYKAHAFLSSGSVIDIARASWTPSPGGKPHPLRMIIAIVGVLLITFVVSVIFGATLQQRPGVFALAAVLLLGLTHLVANGIDERPNLYVVARTIMLAGATACVYFALQVTAERLLAASLPPSPAARGALDIGIVSAVILSFATMIFLQGLVPRHAGEPRWQALYAHVANGFYVNTIANRLVLRLWPSPPHPAIAGSPWRRWIR
jgi:NAD(P)H-quinone oxidoreductase subunit 5